MPGTSQLNTAITRETLYEHPNRAGMKYSPKLDLSKYDMLMAKDKLYEYVCDIAHSWGMDLGNLVAISTVRELLGVKTDDPASKALIVTTTDFSQDAKMLIERHRWTLEGKVYKTLLGGLITTTLLRVFI